MAKRTSSVHPGLIAVFTIVVIGGAVFWGTRDHSPAQPPPNATFAEQRTFWRDRLRRDASDVSAFARLGAVEEHTGFYVSARRNLLAARALGVPDTLVSGPLGRALVGLSRYEEAEPELARAYALAPDDVETMGNLVGVYVLQQDSEKAAQVLQSFLAAHPDIKDEPTLQRLTLSASSIGDKENAQRLAKQLTVVAPNNPLGWIIQGQFALAAKKPEAAQFFERAVACAPNEGSMWYLHGVALETLGDQKGAMEKFRKALALNPRAVDAREKIAKFAAARGEWQEAAKGMVWIANAAPSFESANRAALACEKAKRVNDTLYWSAIAAGFRSAFSTALDLATQARKGAANDAERNRALVAISEAYRGMRRKKEYLDTVEQWTKGETLTNLLDRADAYGKAREFTNQMAVLKQALEKSPENAAAINRNLAQVAASRQLRNEEITYLADAVRLNPKVAQWHTDLGNLYFDRRSEGDYLQKAIAEYQEAIGLSGDDQEAATWLRLGLAYAEQGNMSQALYHAEHAVDLEPGYGPAYQELARLYSKVGDKKTSGEMLDLYQKYVRYDQERSTLKTRARAPQARVEDIIAYGSFLARAGELNEAMAWYEQALSLSPKDQTIRKRLALLYTRLRLPDRALSQGITL